ncbi:MAG TPA: hypothetical protein VFA37_09290 [Gaiellaceae bacterium]|nr:hypothetical protein [Gaiellaceae bacterium]
MSVRRLNVVQWIGVVVAPAAWALQHVVGYGIAQARCSVGGEHWGISNTVWELALLACVVVLVLISEAAAVAVFRATREANYGDGPPGSGRWNGALPETRLHFFATTAMVANVLFLAILLMDGIASALEKACVGS